MSHPEAGGDPRVAGVGYPSLYVRDLEAAVDFWTRVVGPPVHRDETMAGFRLGDSHLTLFGDTHGTRPGEDPGNCEFGIRVRAKEHVDELMEALVEAGSSVERPAHDTWMYRKMRFGCVNTPQGVRVDVYHELPDDAEVEGAPGNP